MGATGCSQGETGERICLIDQLKHTVCAVSRHSISMWDYVVLMCAVGLRHSSILGPRFRSDYKVNMPGAVVLTQSHHALKSQKQGWGYSCRGGSARPLYRG
ncbi:unnamed protein product [Discosporangium mesarthrocarpum]